MFDKTLVLHGGAQHHHHSNRTEVHEHRAPTDASVKLLREMEEAAEKKLLGSFRLEGCPVDCIVHHMRDQLHDEHRFIIRYKLGSKECEVRHVFRHRGESDYDARARMVSELLRVVGEDIASQILGPAMDKALRLRNFP